MFFLGRNSYIYFRLLNNLSLSAEDYVKKFRVFKNFKIAKGYYELKTYIAEKITPEELLLQVIYENPICYVVQPTKIIREVLGKAVVQTGVQPESIFKANENVSVAISIQTGNQAESISKTNENVSVAINVQTGNQAESISKTNEINVSTEVYIE